MQPMPEQSERELKLTTDLFHVVSEYMRSVRGELETHAAMFHVVTALTKVQAGVICTAVAGTEGRHAMAASVSNMIEAYADDFADFRVKGAH